MKAAKLVETQIWNEQVHAEFAEVMEKVHVLFRTAKRHDMLGNMTATSRAEAAEAIAVCEQMFRILLDTEFGKARHLLEVHQELLLPAINAGTLSKEPPQTSPGGEATPSGSISKKRTPEAGAEGMVEPPI